MKLMKVKILRTMLTWLAMAGMGFLTGCATVCDVHDPQLANNPMQTALQRAPAQLRYGSYYSAGRNEDVFTPIFLKSLDQFDGSCWGISRWVIRWNPGALEFASVFRPSDLIDVQYKVFPAKDELVAALLRSRTNSAFHKPFALSLEGRRWWIVYSSVPSLGTRPPGKIYWNLIIPLEWSHRLEFFIRAPALAQNAADGPLLIWWLGDGSAQEYPWQMPNRLYECKGKIYRVQKIDFAADGRMTDLQVAAWSPTMDDVLQGLSSWGHLDREAVTADSAVRMEEQMNNATIEWKTKELPELIGKADAAKLKNMIVQVEKVVLHLDADASAIKAAIDKTERFVPDPRNANAKAPPAPIRGEEIAKLIDQRKALLANILTVLKQALPSKG